MKKAEKRIEASRLELPPGVSMPTPMAVEVKHSLPPDVAAALEAAKKDGAYFIVVARQVSDKGDLEINSCREAGFNADYMLRAWQDVGGKIVSGELAGRPVAGLAK
jgi:hypothetical protein